MLTGLLNAFLNSQVAQLFNMIESLKELILVMLFILVFISSLLTIVFYGVSFLQNKINSGDCSSFNNVSIKNVPIRCYNELTQ